VRWRHWERGGINIGPLSSPVFQYLSINPIPRKSKVKESVWSSAEKSGSQSTEQGKNGWRVDLGTKRKMNSRDTWV